jgi:tRNA(adenine34) deaminase
VEIRAIVKTNRFMEMALEEARAAGERGEVPIGAVVVVDDIAVSRSGNRTRELKDVTAHAEIAAIRLACEALGQERLVGADLYVTLEPCTMCAAAISFARVRRLYYGAEDPKGGGVDNGVRFYAQPTCHHVPEVYSGINEVQSAEILRRFFAERREAP